MFSQLFNWDIITRQFLSFVIQNFQSTDFFSLFFLSNSTVAPPSLLLITTLMLLYFFTYPNTIISLLNTINSQFLYISVNTCTVPTVTNATPVPASSVDYNSNVSYTCADGYSHTAGDLTRSCSADGSLTGTTPVCTSKLQ